MTEFVASNGWSITGEGVYSPRGVLITGTVATEALRELFLAERDAELGRWRSKEHPEYVVYVAGNGLARVLNETDGRTPGLLHKRGSRVTSVEEGVAAEFFAAHPEPKPWESAQPQEVWILTIDGVDRPYTFGNDDVWYREKGVFISQTSLITAGRRIWPEVSA